jgi:hypothetical protein
MKQCIALAGLLCLLASGCANSGLLGKKGCGDSCQMSRARGGVRPLITRDGTRPSGCQFGQNGCMPNCGNEDSGPCGQCEGCAGGGPCARLAERIASGGCVGGAMCGPGGVCPTGTYPEPQMFNSGPPTGQVAYPYYTTRGPRDFLMRNPPSIGPY